MGPKHFQGRYRMQPLGWTSLPVDLQALVFSKLDLESKLEAEGVCKAWHNIFQNAQVRITALPNCLHTQAQPALESTVDLPVRQNVFNKLAALANRLRSQTGARPPARR